MQGYFLIIEPVNHVYAVINAVRDAGYNVIIASTYPTKSHNYYGNIANSVSEYFSVHSWNDVEENADRFLDTFQNYQIVGTYCAIEGGLVFESMIRAYYGLMRNSRHVINLVLDKYTNRKCLHACGLTKIKTFALSHGERPDAIDYPVYVKPNHGGGSLGVKRCTTPETLNQAINAWNQQDKIHEASFVQDYISSSTTLIAETEANGRLISIEGYCHEGKWYPIGVTGRLLPEKNSAVELGLIFPIQLNIEETLFDYVSRIHTSLGIYWGPTHTELMLLADGSAELIEVNLRFAGFDAFSIIEKTATFDLGNLLVNIGLGLKPEFTRTFDGIAMTRGYQPPFDQTSYHTVDLSEHPALYGQYYLWHKEKVYSTPPKECDYLGANLLYAFSLHELVKALIEVDEKVRIDGQPIDNDIYNKKDLLSIISFEDPSDEKDEFIPNSLI